MYINEVMRELLANRKARTEVTKAFKEHAAYSKAIG